MGSVLRQQKAACTVYGSPEGLGQAYGTPGRSAHRFCGSVFPALMYLGK